MAPMAPKDQKGQLTSDRRLKKKITTIASGLEKVAALRGVRFDWRSEAFPERDLPAGPELGFIGQEVEKVVPEAVSVTDNGFRSVKYAQLNALLVEAIKDLKKDNEALQERLARLEAKVAATN